MSKSIKFKNDTYLDSKGITHNRKLLSDILYPVGSIYMSVNSTSPATLFGGSWTQISGRFLYCTTTSKTTGGSTTTGSASGNTGSASGNTGSASGNTGSHVLTVDEIPAHTHVLGLANSGAGSSTVSGSGCHYFASGTLAWTSSTKTLNIPNLKTWNGTNNVNSTGGGLGHTHTLNSHTHTLNSHTHTLNSHTHSQNLPPYFTVYCWYRTA